MPKSFKKEKKLSESDFRLISQSIYSHTGKLYTTEYIRKVFNKNRSNDVIKSEIIKYQKLRNEFELNLKKKE